MCFFVTTTLCSSHNHQRRWEPKKMLLAIVKCIENLKNMLFAIGKSIENLKAVVKLWAWAQTPQGHLNIILIKWQNRAKLVQVWKTNCNRKGGWIKTWIWYEFWLMLECQEWNKYERNETVTKVARVLGSQHPVQAAQSQFLASQCKSYLDDIRLYQDIPSSFGDSEQHVWWSFEVHF